MALPFLNANRCSSRNSPCSISAMILLYFCQILNLLGSPCGNLSEVCNRSLFLANYFLYLYLYLLVLDVDELSCRSFHAPVSDQNLSSLFLNEFVDCASITCCGSEFQLLQIRTMKNVFWTVLAHRGT